MPAPDQANAPRNTGRVTGQKRPLKPRDVGRPPAERLRSSSHCRRGARVIALRVCAKVGIPFTDLRLRNRLDLLVFL